MGIPNYQDILDLLKAGLTVEAREKILELREAALRLQDDGIPPTDSSPHAKVKEERHQRRGRSTSAKPAAKTISP